MTSEILYLKSSSTLSLDVKKKTDRKRAWRFLGTNKNTLWKSPFWGTVHKICMICMFPSADTILLWEWLKMDAGESKVLSENYGCHMSQENAGMKC